MKVKRLVNEPTAAAVYYAHSQGVKGRILVFDLGGGTLDTTILDVEGENIKILTSEGARHLGGSNFDDLLLDAYAEQYKKQTGAALYSDERHRRRVLQATEDAKKMLSKLQRVNDTVANDQNSGIARIDLTRESFEKIIRNMLTRTVFLVEQALDSAKLKPSDIDHVVLVGGSTRIPKVKTILEKMFGKTTKSCGNVDECVALGAALFAKKSAKIQEVCNASYGTLAMVYNAKTKEEKLMNSIVIPKNTPIPCSRTQVYQTSEDNERVIEVDITQGEDEDAKFIDVIGRITLEVPPNRPKGCEIAVTFSYDENQRVRALVVDKQSGRSKEVAVSYKGAGVLSDEELKRRSAHLRTMRIE
jgi:molecular chaperone DnaK